MKIKRVFGLVIILSALLTAPVSASVGHGGGLDSDGGHNCNVGSCAGTYHCHQAWGPGCGGGGSYSSGGYSQPAVTIASCVDVSGSEFTDSEVARIQKALKSGGYRPGPIDGSYGKQTRLALNRFEKKKRLKLSPGKSIYLNSIRRLGVAC
jgi:hypothetical protein